MLELCRRGGVYAKTKMFHVKHFGTIGAKKPYKALYLRPLKIARIAWKFGLFDKPRAKISCRSEVP
jgi:hypothetical protein